MVGKYRVITLGDSTRCRRLSCLKNEGLYDSPYVFLVPDDAEGNMEKAAVIRRHFRFIGAA